MAQYNSRVNTIDWHSMFKLAIIAGIEIGISAKNMFQAVHEFLPQKKKLAGSYAEIVKRGDADEIRKNE